MHDIKEVSRTFKVGYDFEYNEAKGANQVKDSISTFKSNASSIKGLHRFHSEFRFDILKPGNKRITWVHLSGCGNIEQPEECEFDEAISMPPYSQNEIQVSPDDYIEFAV